MEMFYDISKTFKSADHIISIVNDELHLNSEVQIKALYNALKTNWNYIDLRYVWDMCQREELAQNLFLIGLKNLPDHHDKDLIIKYLFEIIEKLSQWEMSKWYMHLDIAKLPYIFFSIQEINELIENIK